MMLTSAYGFVEFSLHAFLSMFTWLSFVIRVPRYADDNSAFLWIEDVRYAPRAQDSAMSPRDLDSFLPALAKAAHDSFFLWFKNSFCQDRSNPRAQRVCDQLWLLHSRAQALNAQIILIASSSAVVSPDSLIQPVKR